MSNPVVTGGSGEQSKTIMIKEEDLQALFHKMMFQVVSCHLVGHVSSLLGYS
jgi:hypothetical protein